MRKQAFWSKQAEDLLKKLYPRIDISHEEIMSVFPGRTWESISSKASSLNLLREAGKVDLQVFNNLRKVYKI